MSGASSSILFACFIFGYLCACESLIQTDDEPLTTKPNESEQKISELQRRKEIAENYMSSLARTKESWVDPYEMISYPLKERQEDFAKLSEESTVKNIYNLNSDEEPLFSDIKGDVIGSKTSKADDIEEDNDIVPGGHFSKDRQQICVLDSIYISRWLKKLISKVEKESYSETSSVTFSLDSSMLDKLKELSTAKSLEIAQLDELVCSMLAQATISKTEEYDWTVVLDYVKPTGWAVVTLFFVYVLYMCSKYHPFLTCIFIFCAVVVFWHWMHLYQQRVAFKHSELHSMQVPDECRKHEFGFLEHVREYFVSFFKSNDCVKYYEALLVDARWEVSISVALSEAVTATLLQPLSVISRVVNTALKQLFHDLTWEIKILIIAFMFLFLIMMCNYRIRFPFFMGAIEPHYPVGSCVENLQPCKTLTSSSKEKVCKMVQYIQGKDSKSLDIRQDMHMDGSLPDVFPNEPSMYTAYTPRPVGVKWRPNKCSKDCGHTSCLEFCKNSVSFEDSKSGNNSEEVGSGIEKVSELAMHSDLCCSCCLSSDDVQYLHEDCRVCSSEESRNAVLSAEEDANSRAVSGCTNSSVDKNFIDDHCVSKSNVSALNRTSKTVSESCVCTVATGSISETSDL